MKGDRHELTPEQWVIHEPPERRFRRRAAAASFGSKKFEQLDLFRTRFKNQIVSAQYVAREEQ